MTETTVDSKLIVKWLLCFLFAGACFLLPLGPAYSFLCQKFAAVTVFCIALMAFDLLPMMFIGFLMPALWVLSGCATFPQALSGWSSSFLIMLLSAFTLTNVLNRCGVLRRVGIHCILFCGGTLNGAIWGLFISCIVLNAASFCMGLALIITLALAFYYSLDLKPEDPESVLVVLAILLGGINSGAFLYSPVTVSLIQTGVQSIIPDFTLSWVELVLHNSPILIFCALLMWGYMKYVNKKTKREVDVVKQRAYFKNELEKMGKIRVEEKKALVILLLMVIFMLLNPIHHIDLAYGFMFATMAMFLPFVNVGSPKDITELGNMFPLVTIVLAFMGIGTVGGACGFANVFAGAVGPVMGDLGPVGSIYATLFLSTLSNFILTPAAMLMLLSGPVVQFCQNLDYNFICHIYSIYLAENAVFHPYEWPSYMTVFAFGLLKANDFIKLCTIKCIFYLIFICIAVIPFWYLIGLI